MSAILLTAPAVEPLSLDEARAFLRVEHNDDDEAIASLSSGARIHIEAATRRALITQSWRLSFDAWPDDGRLKVRPGPLQSLTAARVYDFSNNAHALDVQQPNFISYYVIAIGLVTEIARRRTAGRA
jgi:uncharacterized phiE125 gp8 family phage protein